MHHLHGLRMLHSKTLHAMGLRPPPAWPLQEKRGGPKIRSQHQSPLFGKLSPELRNIVYTDVLGDPNRFLHICLNIQKKCRRVAHWRCTDMESPYPTLQHCCFGQEVPIKNEGRACNVYPRVITLTDDQLLALLLSCRRV